MPCWSAKDDSALRENWVVEGVGWSGWERTLSSKTPSMIARRARELNLACGWSSAELRALRSYAVRGPRWGGWAELPSGREADEIDAKMAELGTGSVGNLRASYATSY